MEEELLGCEPALKRVNTAAFVSSRNSAFSPLTPMVVGGEVSFGDF